MFRSIVIIFALCLANASAQAALQGRIPATPNGADYQAYYDTDLNITWLADANLALTNSFGLTYSGTATPSQGQLAVDGSMDWYTAHTWIAAMNTASYLGVRGWKLPTTAQPDTSCDFVDCLGNGIGTGCIGSELGHLYNVDGITARNPGPFQNMVISVYVSGTEFALDPSQTWYVFFSNGFEYYHAKDALYFVLPVAPGDSMAVPIPPAVFLFPSALAALGIRGRRTL